MTQPATERRGKRKLLIGALQYSISFAILAWLFHRASKDASFDRLRDQASLWQLSNWLLLGGAFVMGLAAVNGIFGNKRDFTLAGDARYDWLQFNSLLLVLGIDHFPCLSNIFSEF